MVVGGWVGGEGGSAEEVIKTGEERGRQMEGWRVERGGVQKEQRRRDREGLGGMGNDSKTKNKRNKRNRRKNNNVTKKDFFGMTRNHK